MSITAAYRFVPLNRQVFIPDFPLPNHDIPYEEGEDGEIEISFQNMTPLFVKNGEGKKDGDYYYSEHIIEDGEKSYFIPATSWKGMIRSIVEIMSYSRLQDDQYDHRTFAYREMHNEDYLSKMDDLKCGWLYVHNNQYYILPSGEIETIEMDCIPSIGGVSYASIKKKDILGKLERYGNRYPEINGKILVFTGHIDGERTGKSHEYLFIKPENIADDSKKQIDDTVVKDFFEAYKDSPYNDAKKGRHIETWLEAGKKLPVFYKEEEGSGVVRIGFTRMHRVLHQYGIADGVKQDNAGLDMAQRIFGYIDDKKSSLRGRVQFSHAWTNNKISDEHLERVVGILGQPKASYYPLYLQNGTHYDDPDLVIAGRKRYVIQQNAIGFPKDLPNNENVQSRLALLPAKNTFTLKIRFHNLLPEELGAILSALTFHNTHDLYHNIGMAKAYGYGKLQWKKVTLHHTTQTDASYYMKRFEDMMNKFLDGNWIHSELIQCLSRYATPQNQGLAVMGLKEYMSTKRNQEQIQELPNYRRITSAFTDVDRISSEIDNRWQACKDLRSQYALNPSLDIEKQLYQNIDDLITYLERKGRNDSQRYTDASAIKQQIEQSRQERANELWQQYQDALANKQYDDATKALEAWHAITGDEESKAAEMEKIRLANQDIEKQSKPLSEQLTFTSAGAFANRLRKARNGQEFSDEQFQEIKQAFKDRKSEIANWTDTRNKRGDIVKEIGEDKTNELFSLIQ